MADIVPWLDPTRQHRQLQTALVPMVDDWLARGAAALDGAVERFESAFASYIGTCHCIGVSSSLAALYLALRAVDVGPGDEVITTPVAAPATCLAIRSVGATPVFVDIEPRTYCLDPSCVEEVVSPRTKALVPVHLFGQPADMPALSASAARHGLAVIEDASQAVGATFGGRHVGTFAHIGCFGFNPGTNLGAYGEAGALVSNDNAVVERVHRLLDRAGSEPAVCSPICYPLRMEAFPAAVLGLKLSHVADWTESRRSIARRYTEGLADNGAVQVRSEQANVRSNYQIYAICADQRHALSKHLAAQRIETAIHCPVPLHLQRAYRDFGYRAGDFPVAESLCARALSLPLFPELTDAEVSRVVAAIRSWDADIVPSLPQACAVMSAETQANRTSSRGYWAGQTEPVRL